jgi:hypothetical protein
MAARAATCDDEADKAHLEPHGRISMFIARSPRYTRWIVALAVLVAERGIVAQGRPVSVFVGVGGSTVSGALAGSARTAWTGGAGIERRLGSAFALGGELVAGQRGARLKLSEFLTSNSRVSFATVGIGPVARYYVRGKEPGSFRPVISSGLLLWKSISCSVDYDSDIGGGFLGGDDLTKPCDDFSPDESGGRPLNGLGAASGGAVLIGFGVSNGTVGLEARAERPLGDGARTTSGRFRFGSTFSLMARFHPKV